MKKLALALFAPFLMCSLFAMEEHNPLDHQVRLLAPVSVKFLKSKAVEAQANIVFYVRIIPQEGEANPVEERLSFNPSTIPSQVDTTFILTNFPHLNELLEQWKEANVASAKIILDASWADPKEFKISGTDYIDFKPEEKF